MGSPNNLSPPDEHHEEIRENANRNDSSDGGSAPSGHGNSDFHLDKLNELEKVMREDVWGRVFRRWRTHEGAAKKYPGEEFAVYGTGTVETRELPKLRGIDWGMLESAAGKLAELASNRDAWLDHLGSLEKDLDQAWQGRAADAARQRYTAVKAPMNKYCDDLNATSRALHKAAQVPKKRVGPGGLSDFKDKSSFFKHYGGDDESEDMLQDLDGMEKMVREGLRYSKSQLQDPEMKEFGKALLPRVEAQMPDRDVNVDPKDAEEPKKIEYHVQITWDDLRKPGAPGCRDGGGTVANKRIKWLDDFCGWYAHDVRALREEIHDAYEHTEEAFSALREQLGKLDGTTFDKLDEGGPRRDGGQRGEQRSPADAGLTTRSQGGGTGGMPGGGGTGGAPGGSGVPGGQTAGMPQQPSTPSSEEIRDRMSESGEEAARVAPSGGGGPGTDRGLDQVTIGEGAERIAVREADSQGRTQLTLLDEQGQPRTYQIPFGDQGGAAVPDSTDAGRSAEAPGTPGPRGDPLGETDPTAPRGDSRGPTLVRPNDDGTAVIREGERTINVAREVGGGLRLTIDDGDGQPSTRTVDFGEERPGVERSAGAESGRTAPAAASREEFQRQAPPGEQPGQTSQQRVPPQQAEPGVPRQDDLDSAGAPRTNAAFSASPVDPGGGGLAPAAQQGATPAPESLGVPRQESATGGEPVTGTSPETGQRLDGRPADSFETAARTTSQWGGSGVFGDAEGFSSRSTFTAFSGDLFSAPEDDGGNVWGSRPTDRLGDIEGEAGLATMDGKSGRTESQGATGLASMGESAGASGQGEQGGARGGMMPMGGMGGAGQQGGGDEERSNDSPWRTEGDLFDDGLDAETRWQYRAVLGEPEEK
ncbi:Proteins of 100 residues with WXG [Actinopolyspora xinjiangensis]|uniref:Proteins of 100 residues with WXG n=1 Tax=Actinopolyspora xinjiangensis TaxID=405564 RepID=A0A1H0Q6G4_9ACTN|nr:WXG100 family type VII secretion target [Actinopolyspora xinjiangensis]SDP12219.1 Proteins of 100 residues with WXG [Actinopolyspora xinjiangensis]